MKRTPILMIAIFTIMFLNGCTGDPVAQKDENYESTKKMVADILQTEEGKKAITKALKDEELKDLMVVNNEETKKTVEKVLTSEKGKKMWEELFEDNEFRNHFATSVSDEQKELMKDLMKDPDYQKKLLELFKNPEMTKQTIEALKSQKFRKHIDTIMEETMTTPRFEKKLEDALIKANKKQSEKSKKDESA